MKFIRALPWLLIVVLASALIYFWVKKQMTFDWLLKSEPTETEVAYQVGSAMITKMEQLGKLELVKYELKDVAEFTKKNRILSDDKILMLIAGEAVGCIDLRKLDSTDINHMGDTVNIMLPNPELCYYKLNHDQCKVYDLTLTKMFDKTSLVEDAYRKAENRIEEIALQSGILEKSKENAELILRPILESISGKTVFIQFPPAADSLRLLK